MVELLIDLGASAELRTKQDMSALLTAVTRNKPKIVNLLLQKGCSINLKSRNGVSLSDILYSELILTNIFKIGNKETC